MSYVESLNSNNKRLIKNTLLLYFRMILTMGISLYTSRVVLSVLGVEDFGIYNIVGGIVAMFNIISSALSSAISRFITYELGRNNIDELNKVFSTAITVQILISLFLLIIAETIGLWFLNNKLIIPIERMQSAYWVYQFSIITFVINLISVPYNATIIAYEKMSAFAYISIAEAFGKLTIAFAIAASPFDKLLSYGFMLMIMALIIRLIYSYYCKINFVECKYNFICEWSLIRKMLGFAGWNFIGASSAVLRDQGGTLLISMFCAPSVNAARGIAMQVTIAIQGFVTNFMTALNPQITKSYASGDYKYMMSLIFQGARFSYYILLLLALPIFINVEYLLSIWLEIVPNYTSKFIQLSLVFALSESLANSLVIAMLSTGNIRNYQIIVGGVQLMNLPISYIFLKLGYPPEIVYFVAIFISVCSEFARLYMLKSMINLPVKSFILKIYLNVIIVTFFAGVIPLLCSRIMDDSFRSFLVLSILCVISTIISILFIGCNTQERNQVFKKLTKVLKLNR